MHESKESEKNHPDAYAKAQLQKTWPPGPWTDAALRELWSNVNNLLMMLRVFCTELTHLFLNLEIEKLLSLNLARRV
jgi:hypothetical protein